jgi:acetyl esterase/lipase
MRLCFQIAMGTCVAFTALVFSLLALPTESSARDAAFYSWSSAGLSEPPGSLLRAEPMAGAPLGADAYRILYRSTGLDGEPIAVSGVVVVPTGDPPSSGRPIVAWAHPTTGVASKCAPSLNRLVFQTIIGLRDFVAAGDIVVATDYPGLGTPGPHPYLIGASEGRSVLDAVRAARMLPRSHAGNEFVVWGHSQGGQAAIFTGEMASSYAPELDLRGVALAAPATDLLELMRKDAGTAGGRNLTAMALWSWAQVYDLPLQSVVLRTALSDVDRLSSECLESASDFIMRSRDAAPLSRHFLGVEDITRVDPWRAILDANVAGLVPSSVPVFVSQGDADLLVPMAVTKAYVDRLCRAGTQVRFVNLPGVGHGLAAYRSQAAAVGWIAGRVARRPPPNDCGASGAGQ